MNSTVLCWSIAFCGGATTIGSYALAQSEKNTPPFFRAGAATVNITPAPSIGLAGYYFERGADGTNDDLFAKALVLEAGGTKVVLVTLDLISTTRSMVEAARREIEKVTGIPGSNVMIMWLLARTTPKRLVMSLCWSITVTSHRPH